MYNFKSLTGTRTGKGKRLAADYFMELMNGALKRTTKFLNLDMELIQRKAQLLAFNFTLRRDYLRGAKGEIYSFKNIVHDLHTFYTVALMKKYTNKNKGW